MIKLAFDNDYGHRSPSLRSAFPEPRLHSPMVTIAIPTFNRAAHLRRCIKSALAQTYGNFEVLVSNNASTDATRDVLSEFSDSRLRIIQQTTNIGLLPNWNACLDNARGEYVVFLSDDDRISPFLLDKSMGVIRSRPGLPIVVTLSNLHAVSIGTTFPAQASFALSTGVWHGTQIMDEFLTNNITVTMCSVVLRTELVRANGGFSLAFPHTADIAAWAPLLFLGQAGLVNEPCATFSYHNNSETSRLSPQELLSDGRQMEVLISDLAAKCVIDPARQRMLRANARRCFAQRGLTILSDYRSGGGDARQLLRLLWQYRRDLGSAGVTVALRFFALILIPRSLIDHLRRQRRGMSEQIV
jgi:hypothetical protein